MRRRKKHRTPGTWFLAALILTGFGVQVATGAWEDPRRLAELGAMIPELVRGGAYWRLVSPIFLHGNGTVPGTLIHLSLNLLSLVNLARIFEWMFGTRRLVLTFFMTGAAASVASMVYSIGWSVGASGAIFGVVGALVSSIGKSVRLRRDRVASSILFQCVILTIANIAIGFQIPQIDNAAHIGGLAAGLLLGAMLPQRRMPPPRPAEAVVDVTPQPLDDPSPHRRRSQPFDA